ncbi:alpha/beta hydrolase family esterase [Haliscomenobacter hydrossis]|uniref:Poly(3-hydroxybutyrate) depolymerase-like protein n=1 Tax=Haliscomenobacter hydrossis (strain ATCC 27775 / DSM 1100 / LMG 10767 / O) TaxID=760192 RepID=F4L7G9_HALH1|nr:PHB depolymerase family esterase [Haliscomenobacter hydrossis]AEE54149.1 poly(3-hydroxybutyrate) depolymerase-like protein [Haliscomenobacter hydrossis DSM 1100]
MKFPKTSILPLCCCLFTLTASAQLISDSMEIENHYRSFHFNRPENTRKNKSLIFVLHGSGRNGKQMMAGAAKLDKLSSSENLIVVYPDGYKRYWNECRKAATTPPNLENINEEAFFEAMIQYFKKRYRINTKNVFVVGTSGGGHMAYKLAMTLPEKIKAITAIVASLPDPSNFDCLEKKVAKPVMIVNGTADPLNRWEGGEIILGNGVNMGLIRSTESSFQYWSALAGYTAEPVKTALPDIDPKDGKMIERYQFKAKGKPEVILLKVIGGKHDYPGDIDVHVEAWSFFKRQ